MVKCFVVVLRRSVSLLLLKKMRVFLALLTMVQSAAYCFTCIILFAVNHYKYTYTYKPIYILVYMYSFLWFLSATAFFGCMQVTAFIYIFICLLLPHSYAHTYICIYVYNNTTIKIHCLCCSLCVIVYLFYIVQLFPLHFICSLLCCIEHS